MRRRRRHRRRCCLRQWRHHHPVVTLTRSLDAQCRLLAIDVNLCVSTMSQCVTIVNSRFSQSDRSIFALDVYPSTWQQNSFHNNKSLIFIPVTVAFSQNITFFLNLKKNIILDDNLFLNWVRMKTGYDWDVYCRRLTCRRFRFHLVQQLNFSRNIHYIQFVHWLSEQPDPLSCTNSQLFALQF